MRSVPTEMAREPTLTRRALLSTVALGAAALGGCTSSASPDRSAADTPDFDGWLSNTPTYDGIADRTGRSTVTVAVGGKSGVVFAPPAIRVDSGTTVRWEWTGGGSAHNVKAKDGSFESQTTSAAGVTFEQTFGDSSVVKYLCVPHEYAGMKGVVEIG